MAAVRAVVEEVSTKVVVVLDGKGILLPDSVAAALLVGVSDT